MKIALNEIQGIGLLFIVLIPLLGFSINGLFGKKWSANVAGSIASAALFVPFSIAVWLFYGLGTDFKPFEVLLFNWFSVGQFSVDMALAYDQLAAVMLLIITGIGFLIHVYSIGYMHDDEAAPRFFAYLNLFVFFMLMLVLGANYLITFIGWEGVGLCSYLLIGFWYKNMDYNDAAKKAFVMNRIGDLGFLIAIFLLMNQFGTIAYSEVTRQVIGMEANTGILVTITLLLFVAATGKSAQIPLFTWLPDAMAGPTPVSALIHAATMVTAGIYLVVRSNALFALAPFTSEIIIVIGIITAMLTATIGLKQNDIKKVLAYSTVSQLGYMFVALGVGAYSTAMFHVTTHAFFKALLFLGAGSVIHSVGGEQDIRYMGGLRKKLPITHITFLIGTLAIAGLPPFAGFFSKDEILAKAYAFSPWIFTGLAVTSVLTATYMFRLYFLTFGGKFRGSESQAAHLHESPSTITIPLIVLAILSTFGGFLGMPSIISEHHAFSAYLAPIIQFANEHAHVSHTFEWIVIGVSLVILFIIIAVTYNTYAKKAVVPLAPDQETGIGKLLSHKYYIDEIYDIIIVKPFMALSNFFYQFVDLKIIDGAVNGLGKVATKSSQWLRLAQSGNIGLYIFCMAIAVILFLVYNSVSQ